MWPSPPPTAKLEHALRVHKGTGHPDILAKVRPSHPKLITNGFFYLDSCQIIALFKIVIRKKSSNRACPIQSQR